MKKTYRLLQLALLAAACACCLPLRAQDVHLSQFYETPLMRNPALAGIFTGDVRVQFVHRNQWGWTGYPYQTSVISAEYKSSVGHDNDFLTTGLQAYYDDAGSTHLTTAELMPVINYHKSLDQSRNSYLSMGFMVGMVSKYFNLSDLTFDSQYANGIYTPGAPSGEAFTTINKTFLDIATGISYNSAVGERGNFFIGMGAWHLNQPQESFKNQDIRLQTKWELNGGLHVPVGPSTDMIAEVNYLRQGDYTETQLGVLFNYDLSDYIPGSKAALNNRMAVGLGGFLRWNDAFIPVVKLTYHNIEVFASYDVNISRLKSSSLGQGGYEISVAYKGFLSQTSEALKQVLCPRF